MYVNQSNLMGETTHYIKRSHTPLGMIINSIGCLKTLFMSNCDRQSPIMFSTAGQQSTTMAYGQF